MSVLGFGGDYEGTQSLPDGPMTRGIDGGMVRARHKAGFFDVIAGKSLVALTREEAEANPSAKRFALYRRAYRVFDGLLCDPTDAEPAGRCPFPDQPGLT